MGKGGVVPVGMGGKGGFVTMVGFSAFFVFPPVRFDGGFRVPIFDGEGGGFGVVRVWVKR